MTKRWLLLVCSLGLCGAVALWFAGRPAYHRYKETRALHLAQKFLARGDLPSASLSSRQCLLLNPRNLEATRILAQVAELAAAPQMLDWRRRVVELAPTVENQLALAAAGLRVEAPPYPLASEILEQLSPIASNRIEYCNLAAERAIKLEQWDEAEIWFQAAEQLQPSNLLHSLNLAVLRLKGTNPVEVAQARMGLEALSLSTAVSEFASRSLVADSMTRKDWLTAKRYSEDLLRKPVARFDDRLRHLEILHEAGLQDFESLLAQLQETASTNRAQACALSAVLVRYGLAARAANWLNRLPGTIRAEQPLALARVQCCFALNDWKAAENLLSDKEWGELEPMRLGLLSQAALGLQDPQAAQVRWRLALSRADRRLGSLIWLAAKAEEWGRETDKWEVLGKIAEAFPKERWAFGALERHYLATGQTARLHDLYCRLVETQPEDCAARNNFATTALLLRTNLARAFQTARQLYAEHAEDPAITSTYAYSLHLQGKTAAGLAALEALNKAKLARPAIALYYGALLAADGQLTKAGKYLKLAQEASLLPEERALLGSLRPAP